VSYLNPHNIPASKYQWEENHPGLPRRVVGVPKGEGFSLGKIITFNFVILKTLLGLIIAQSIYLFSFIWQQYKNKKIIFKGTVDLGLLTILSNFNTWNKIDDINQFFKPWTFLKKPDVAQAWQEDQEFGRQRIAGINPVVIQKCKQEDIHPNGNFPVTDELVKSQLGDFTLASALANNRLYLVNYKILDKTITSDLEDELGRYHLAPLCLLYVNSENQLLPIAIQLQQKNGHDDTSYNPIFTPNSSPQDWLTAKTAVGCSDIAYQGVVSHLLKTHLIIELFIVSTFRQLSPQHILFQLLKPHFFNTIAINDMARLVFLGRHKFFDNTGALGYVGSSELLSREYSGKGKEYQGPPWQFYQTALPYDLATRDVYDLPGYYYRDDALLLWNAISQYVTDVLQSHYQVTDDIVNDQELQAWKNELIDPNCGNVKGLLAPEKAEQLAGTLNNLNDLIEIVTNIIFTATGQHSAVNFGQYDYGAWIPNMPFALYLPASNMAESNSEKNIELINKLPNRWQSIRQIVIVNTLTMQG